MEANVMSDQVRVRLSDVDEFTPDGRVAPDTLHLGCGEDYREGWHNVDYVPSVDPDEVVDLDKYPWPWGDGSFETIRGSHVFEHLEDVEAALRECERILEPGGRLIVTVPVGVDARADPDHNHEWTWRTPTFYCGARHWDTDVGLDVVDRRVDIWSHRRPPRLARLITRYWTWKIRRYGAGAWCFSLPAMSGEFTTIFERPELER